MSEWFEQYGYAEVHPQLIVGAVLLDANDVQVMVDHHVDRVLNLVHDEEYASADARLEVEIALEANQIVERRVRVIDFGNLSLAALDQAADQVRGWLEEDHTVYLHCRAGWQRSATVAAAVIAIREDIGIEQALGRLRARKPSADPLPHQKNDLRGWFERRQRSAQL